VRAFVLMVEGVDIALRHAIVPTEHRFDGFVNAQRNLAAPVTELRDANLQIAGIIPEPVRARETAAQVGGVDNRDVNIKGQRMPPVAVGR